MDVRTLGSRQTSQVLQVSSGEVVVQDPKGLSVVDVEFVPIGDGANLAAASSYPPTKDALAGTGLRWGERAAARGMTVSAGTRFTIAVGVELDDPGVQGSSRAMTSPTTSARINTSLAPRTSSSSCPPENLAPSSRRRDTSSFHEPSPACASCGRPRGGGWLPVRWGQGSRSWSVCDSRRTSGWEGCGRCPRRPHNSSARPSNYFSAQFCGGSLVAPDLVFTAAHCLVDRIPSCVHAVVGANDLCHATRGAERIGVSTTLSTRAIARADLVLLQLKHESRYPPVPIAAHRRSLDRAAQLIATGWGLASNGGVAPCASRSVVLAQARAELCGHAAAADDRISDRARQLCARAAPGQPRNTCQGD
jgi:hypothetical protein